MSFGTTPRRPIAKGSLWFWGRRSLPKQTPSFECDDLGLDLPIKLGYLPADAGPRQLEYLALLCANCHRMIHRRSPWLSVDELKSVLD